MKSNLERNENRAHGGGGRFCPPAAPGAALGWLPGGFLNSEFGKATAMGAGFGIGDDLIDKIF